MPGAILGHLGNIFGHLGAIFGEFGGLFGAILVKSWPILVLQLRTETSRQF